MQKSGKFIDGEIFERLVLYGALNLQSNIQEVNDLNVFPIPDGDTGENMYLTFKGGLDQLKASTSKVLGEKARALAEGMLLNARGNSGVILSQLFFGLSKGLIGKDSANVYDFGKALNQGVKCAYEAVVHPVEGTILTVAREAVENTCSKLNDDMTVEEFFKIFLVEMRKSLERTPNLLAVLKESGVIDSGGAGLVYIMEGFCKAFGDEELSVEVAATADEKKSALDFSKFNEDSVMEFGYCTELLLQLQNCKTNISEFSVKDLISFLETLGDSIVAFQTGTIIKIHVHTMTPWTVLAHCQKFGEFLTVKIENMTLQHNESVQKENKSKTPKIKRARRKFATVTVATGEGLINTFKELGADYVITGGQTNNPSSEDFIEAFDEVNADYIFVLPNNGNILLAAKQAAGIYKDSDVRVIESKSIGQGYSALSMLDYASDDIDTIIECFNENIGEVITGSITHAVRTTTVNGVHVTEGDYIGFSDHVMHVSTPSKMDAVKGLLEKLKIGEKSFLIAVRGKDATEEEGMILEEFMAANYPNIEVYSIDGGQDVYDFLLIIE